jgi:hypothetical protein
MVGAEVLREYLVKLGFSIDNTAQAKIKETLTVLEKQLDSLSKSKAFSVLTHGALAYVGAISAVVTASAGLMQHVAEADMHYQKLALSMHMSTQNAKEMTIAQKALGSSLEEIVWIPELRERYHELRKLVNETQAPKEDLELIRKMGFEYTKFKVLLISASEHIAASLIKYLKVNLVDIKKWMESANKWLKENLPIWTEKIATFLGKVWNLAQGLWEIGKKVVQSIQAIIHILPEGANGFILFFSAIALGLRLNPTLLMLAALFLMIEDWWTWKKDKENDVGFRGLWESFEGLGETFIGPLKSLGETMNQVFGKSFSLVFWDAFDAVISSIALSIATITYGFDKIINLAKFASSFLSSHGKESIYAEYNPLIEAAKAEEDKTMPAWKKLLKPELKYSDKVLNLIKKRDEKIELNEARAAVVDITQYDEQWIKNEKKFQSVQDAIAMAYDRNVKARAEVAKQQEQGAKNGVTAAIQGNIPTVMYPETVKYKARTKADIGKIIQGLDPNEPFDIDTGIPGPSARSGNTFLFPNATIVTPDPYNFVDQAMQISAQRGFSMFGSTAPAGGR